MSIPRIPGFSDEELESLADYWEPPEGSFPQELWPEDILRSIVPNPTGWITVEEWYCDDTKNGGRGAILVHAENVAQALSTDDWIGKSLGSAGTWRDGAGNTGFEDGLSCEDRGIQVDFFVQVRAQHDLSPRVVELTLPFLWYWDAIRGEDCWYYLNSAGRDQPLVKVTVQGNYYKVQVRALELRCYLADVGQVLIAQVDHVRKVRSGDFEHMNVPNKSDWSNFTWYCRAKELSEQNSSFSRLVGQYAVAGVKGSRVPWWEESNRGAVYPEFQYGIDPSNGMPIKHTCDPDLLGTYFDRDKARLHYLTPVYFNPDVLTRYTQEVTRYYVTPSEIRCLDMWHLKISRNTAGLVEVYLGDLGRDLPADEWSHWLTYNVAPEGEMAEERFRRDILGQWVEGRESVEDLRRLVSEINQKAEVCLGGSIWRSLREPDKTAFERLHAPTSAEPRSLHPAVLTLTKALVEAIDKPVLAAFLGIDGSSLASLDLLEQVVVGRNGESSILEPLRALQSLRSRGGIAHMTGRSARQQCNGWASRVRIRRKRLTK